MASVGVASGAKYALDSAALSGSSSTFALLAIAHATPVSNTVGRTFIPLNASLASATSALSSFLTIVTRDTPSRLLSRATPTAATDAAGGLNPKPSLSGGAIASIVIGAILCFIAISSAVWVTYGQSLRRRESPSNWAIFRKRRKQPGHEQILQGNVATLAAELPASVTATDWQLRQGRAMANAEQPTSQPAAEHVDTDIERLPSAGQSLRTIPSAVGPGWLHSEAPTRNPSDVALSGDRPGIYIDPGIAENGHRASVESLTMRGALAAGPSQPTVASRSRFEALKREQERIREKRKRIIELQRLDAEDERIEREMQAMLESGLV